MSPFRCQRAQQDVGWHDALLAMVLAPWNYEPSACGRFVCHGRWSRKIESVAVGAVAAKSRRFYRVLERSNAPRHLFGPATRGCASHKSRLNQCRKAMVISRRSTILGPLLPGLELIKNLSIQEIWSSLYRGRGDCLRRAKLAGNEPIRAWACANRLLPSCTSPALPGR